MGTHAKLSPSARYRWKRCPGSVRECEKYPDSSGEAAKDGTRTHLVLEACIKGNITNAKSLVGSKMRNPDVEEFVIDAGRAERVQVALDYIQQRMKELKADQVVSERRISSLDQFGTEDLSGTLDVFIFSGNGVHTVELIDYKDGMNKVDAEDNEQLELYGLNFLGTQPKDHPIQFLRMTIIQPKLISLDISPIDVWDISVADLLARKNNVISEAYAALDPNAPLVPGDVQCKYCPHRGNCRPLIDQSLKSLGVDFDNMNVASDVANSNPEEMTDVRIRELMEAAPLIQTMLKGIEAEAERRLLAGNKIEGLKLVKGRGSRSWSTGEGDLDEEKLAAVLKKMGVPKEVMYTTSLISIPQLEKAKWTAKVKGEEVMKGLSKLQKETIDKEYTRQSEGSISVKLASDRGEPYEVTNVESLFSAVTVDAPMVSDLPGEPPSCTTTVAEESVAPQSTPTDLPAFFDVPPFFS